MERLCENRITMNTLTATALGAVALAVMWVGVHWTEMLSATWEEARWGRVLARWSRRFPRAMRVDPSGGPDSLWLENVEEILDEVPLFKNPSHSISFLRAALQDVSEQLDMIEAKKQS